MASMYSSVERDRSVPSMRRMKAPPWWRAKSQLKSAVRAPPTWRWPVGLGAKRTRTASAVIAHSTLSGFWTSHPGRGVGSEVQAADDRAGEETDHQHDPAPDRGGVDHGSLGVDAGEDGSGDGFGLAGEGRDGEAGGHGGLCQAA